MINILCSDLTSGNQITLATSNSGGAGAAIDNMVNNLSVALGVGMSRSKSDTSSTTYNNSQLTAENGTITINSLGTTASGDQTGGDTTLKGTNLLAENIIINSERNLDVESMQDSYNQKSKSFGMNLGGGAAASGGGSGSAGINYSSSKTDRLWTDNQTSIIGTNSVEINTGKNTNLVGAVIANSTNGQIGDNAIDGGNLTLNTDSLTFSNLYDHDYSRSSGFGLQLSNLSIGSKTTTAIDPTSNNPVQTTHYYPKGSTTITAQNEGYKKEQTTYATIGDGTINITDNSDISNLNRDINNTQEITKDTITGALNTSVTLDNRLFSEEGFNSISQDMANLPGNLKTETKFVVKLPGELVDAGIYASLAVYDKFTPSDITDPKIRSQIREDIRQAAIEAKDKGDSEVLRAKVKELTGKTPTSQDVEAIIALTNNRDFGELKDDIGGNNYLRFLDKYTLQTGVFFDGTNNKESRDILSGEETNVARIKNIYGTDARVYAEGIGTSGNHDTFDQATGYGISDNQQYAKDHLFNDIVNKESNKNVLFFPLDVVGFSRGATTATDFINKINNESYWNLGILARSALLFDPVGSYGVAGNSNDLGKNFSLPTNIIAIQINAADENRNNFPLQALSNSDGSLAGDHWKEITLPGAHSDIGGGYANGYQNKDQNMALYSMQTMINEASQYGIKFNEIPTNQQPQPGFNQLMNFYNQAQENYKSNPTIQNQVRLNSISGMINDMSVHNSTFSGTYKIQNYSVGDRNTYYPNEIKNNKN